MEWNGMFCFVIHCACFVYSFRWISRIKVNSVSCSFFEVRFQCFHSVTLTRMAFHSLAAQSKCSVIAYLCTVMWMAVCRGTRTTKAREKWTMKKSIKINNLRGSSDKCVLSCFRSFRSLSSFFYAIATQLNRGSFFATLFFTFLQVRRPPNANVLLEYIGLSHENENIINDWHVT